MNPDTLAYLGGIVRIVTSIIGGYLAQRGLATQSEVDSISGAAVIVATGVWSIWAKRKALSKAAAKAAPLLLLLLIPCSVLMSGCAMTYNSTPIMSESDGATVVANATVLKIGFGAKDSTSIGAYKLSADGGLSMDNLATQSDTSLAMLKAIELGAQLGAAYTGRSLPAPVTSSAPASISVAPGDCADKSCAVSK